MASEEHASHYTIVVAFNTSNFDEQCYFWNYSCFCEKGMYVHDAIFLHAFDLFRGIPVEFTAVKECYDEYDGEKEEEEENIPWIHQTVLYRVPLDGAPSDKKLWESKNVVVCVPTPLVSACSPSLKETTEVRHCKEIKVFDENSCNDFWDTHFSHTRPHCHRLLEPGDWNGVLRPFLLEELGCLDSDIWTIFLGKWREYWT